MEPTTIATIAEAGKLAVKGSRWGYGKLKDYHSRRKSGKEGMGTSMGYAQCMGIKLKGQMKGMDKVERKQKFCAVSKVCSGKAANEAEAARMCK